ncbi:hypothetical protein SHELI_v1c10520 [Spiroplasma helicoides]|uniref:Membrane transporter protein n=1 Tax=Spiroplasma helicoides TaxID=216938 RepID=A0A1B3SM35_9MOLU|nr:sulfite exporter TauE/SafE family protein [Spiroplasma helicoides]AOG60999.1 hypothetical protein SHELI_v1c10520 [Spiroplasma helicoides]
MENQLNYKVFENFLEKLDNNKKQTEQIRNTFLTKKNSLKTNFINKKINRMEYIESKKSNKKCFNSQIKNQTSVEKKLILEGNQIYENLVLEINKNKKWFNKMVGTKTLKIIGIIILPILISIGILIDYLVVKPHNQNANKSTEWVGIGISIALLVLEFLLITFLIHFSSKKFIFDTFNKGWVCYTVGFTASFFDTLGVGSFATNTGLLKSIKYIKDDKKLPGTLNFGMAIPNLLAGILLMGSIEIDMTTFASFVICAVCGTIIGNSIVNKINKKLVALIMGIVLAISALLMLMNAKGIELLPQGDAKGVSDVWWKLLVGCLVFIVLGMLISFGVGLYAPAMILISLLQMDFLVCFPVMACSSGLTMHINVYKFYRSDNYMPRTSFLLTLGGTTGVIVSYLIFFLGIETLGGVPQKGISDVFKWISVFVIAYSSYSLLKGYYKQVKKDKQDKISSVNNDSK